MDNERLIQRMHEVGLIPVVKLEHVERDSLALAKALIEGGIPAAEVTFRAAGAAQAIRLMHEAYPDMLVGAGTVLNVDQAREAYEAGACFIVSPGTVEEVLDFCLEKDLLYLPGCATATEMIHAYNRGCKVLKFFPAEQAGGLPYMKAVAAAIADMKFVPTGGISPKNLETYIKASCIVAAGGSYMVKAELINEGRWAEITAICKESRALIDQARA